MWEYWEHWEQNIQDYEIITFFLQHVFPPLSFDLGMMGTDKAAHTSRCLHDRAHRDRVKDGVIEIQIIARLDHWRGYADSLDITGTNRRRASKEIFRLAQRPQGWSVTQGKRLSWPIMAASPGIAAILPGMQTDIELNHPTTGRRIVIDTKFAAICTASTYRDQILKSGYLYQLYTYLRSQERPDDPASLSAEGMLRGSRG
jgi:hypothetical protein